MRPAGVQEDLEPGDHLDRGHRRRPCQLQHLHLDQVKTSSLNKHLFKATIFSLCSEKAKIQEPGQNNYRYTCVYFVRFDLDFWEWIEEIQWYTYWNAM